MTLRVPFNECFWQDYLAGQESRLPTLAEVSCVTDRVTRILGGNPGTMQLQGTNTYLVGTGRSRILIDTGEVSHILFGRSIFSVHCPLTRTFQGAPIWIQKVVEFLRQGDLDISHILLTHWHGDHTGGVPDLVAYDAALADRVYKNRPDRGQKNIADGQVFSTEGATVRAVFTPGHADDHMCFVLEEERALFTGDNVLGHGYSVVQDLGTYMKSLAVMAAQECAVGYPAHGAKIEDMPAKMRDYIRHKEFRVQQVFSALKRSREELAKMGQPGTGALTVHEIVRALYGDVPADVVEMALEPFFTQVLWKLAEDRRVGFEPGSARTKKWFVSPRALKVTP